MASRLGAFGGRADGARDGWTVAAVAAAIFLGTVSSPPALLDDVDAAYAQIARTMLESGDWVTARLNGVPYFDKPPGQVWAIAASYAVFGVSDWAARLPMALASVLLCWLCWRTGRWAFGSQTGLYAGLGLATCCGLFLFTRFRIPDIYIACSSLWVLDCFLRAQEGSERTARARMASAGAAVGLGVLFKGLVAAVLPLGGIGVYLACSGRWRAHEAWRRLGLPWAAAAALAVAGPWHLAAALRHPPIFDLTLESGPGQYRGFFWRYFVNEHILRFLGLRHPADYDRVPLPLFWAGHLIWLFPWTGLALGARRLSFRPATRAGRGNLLMAAFCGFTLLFFLASTTQEYYTLPAYAPAMLLLAGAAAASARQLTLACRIAATVYGLALAAALALLALAGPAPAAGDISDALASSPEAYTLSLGHFQDLTLAAFAFLRTPLCLAAAAFTIGTCGGWCLTGCRAAGAVLCAAGLLLHAAHQAMAVFEPHLSSRHLARAYLEAPPGILVLDHEYYAFSSLVFYANRPVLLLNGRRNAIEYGSHAPGAPDVFLDDQGLAKLWSGGEPAYLATYFADIARIKEVVGLRGVSLVARGGGKALLGMPRATLGSARSPRPQASATVVGGLARTPAGPQGSARTPGSRP